MSFHEMSNTELNTEIRALDEEVKSENTRLGWSVAMIAVGIPLVIISFVNEERGRAGWWTLLGLVSLVIGLLGASGYYDARKKILECQTLIAMAHAILNERQQRKWKPK